MRNDGQQENRSLSATVSLFALKAGLILGVVFGPVGLSACGGGGGPSSLSMPSVGSAPEIVITPPANRAPMAVESIPVQKLTTGPNARIVDVATYFMDPDNDQLTYSAVSDQQDIVKASMSGSMMTLTPVSAGTTTVTVTASDGHADAIQTIDTVVPETSQTPVQEPETSQMPVQEPDNRLTGIREIILREGPQGRKTSMRMTLEPADAIWSGISFDIDPDDAGEMCCYQSFAESIYFKFVCSEGYNSDVTTTIIVRDPNGHTVKESVSVTCR